MKKILSILPTQSLIYFLICGAGVLVFIFLIIIPNQNMSAELDQEIDKLNDRVEQRLAPDRMEFHGRLSRVTAVVWPD